MDGGDGGDGSTPTAAQYDFVAQVVAPTIANDFNSQVTIGDLSIGTTPTGVTPGTDAGDFHASGADVGATASVTYEVTCTNATNGNVPCGSTTDTAKVDWSDSWSVTTSDYTVTGTTAENHGTWSVTGLQSQTVTFANMGSYGYTVTTTNSSAPVQVNGMWSLTVEKDEATYQKTPLTLESVDIEYMIDASGFASAGDASVREAFMIEAALTYTNKTWTLTLDGSHSYTVSTDGKVM
jgi:hypothetical protein